MRLLRLRRPPSWSPLRGGLNGFVRSRLFPLEAFATPGEHLLKEDGPELLEPFGWVFDDSLFGRGRGQILDRRDGRFGKRDLPGPVGVLLDRPSPKLNPRGERGVSLGVAKASDTLFHGLVAVDGPCPESFQELRHLLVVEGHADDDDGSSGATA